MPPILDGRAIDQERASLIAQTLDTPEGRIALAQSVAESIRNPMNYQAIGRSLLTVDELPPGAIGRSSFTQGTFGHTSSHAQPEPSIRMESTPVRSFIINSMSRFAQREEDEKIYDVVNATLEARTPEQKEKEEFKELEKQIPNHSIGWLG